MTGRAVGAVAELFAGVGGFRLALEGCKSPRLPSAGWRVAWSNQWEPGSKRQDASDCYVQRFGAVGHINDDIARTLDEVEMGRLRLPEIDLVVGGFPCQDYSVARVLAQAIGIQGKKGVLWWEIHRFLKLTSPRFVFLENVDRLLKSPAGQRGRDFGVILRCLADLGYAVEWRVVNAADYGFVQRRRRTFIVGWRAQGDAPAFEDAVRFILHKSVLGRALPAMLDERAHQQTILGLAPPPNCVLPQDLLELSESFAFEFANAGLMQAGRVWTFKVKPLYAGPRTLLCDVLIPEDEVPSEYFIPAQQQAQWRYLKGAKREPRNAATGYRYFYTEGALPFPDPLDQPSRTILTGEGGTGPSRSKHVVATESGRFRRLTPIELERLNGFPDGWTDTGMSDGRRAFCMGNALVVGLVHRIAGELAVDAQCSRSVSTQAMRFGVASEA